MNRRAFLQSLLAGSVAAVTGVLTSAPKQLGFIVESTPHSGRDWFFEAWNLTGATIPAGSLVRWDAAKLSIERVLLPGADIWRDQ